VFCDPGIDLAQAWLDGYCLEPYIFFKRLKLGYRVTEVVFQRYIRTPGLVSQRCGLIIDWWKYPEADIPFGIGIEKNNPCGGR
jgi:dolichol-phosphate mannosyltransferase